MAGTGFFPSNTANNYVYAAGLWFGAQYDADGDGDLDKVFTQGYNPLAGDSEFREGRNDQAPDDPMTRVFDSTESNDMTDWPEQFKKIDEDTGDMIPFVRSDQDLVTTYTTRNKIPVFGSFQMPLEVNQRSLAFKTGLSAQVIFFIFDVVNWGDQVMSDAWVGCTEDAMIGVQFSDDLTSFIRNRDAVETPEPGDSVRINMAYIWDSDFSESNFTGTPGFMGIAFLRSPGNPNDGIDNDGDGFIDESPYDGVDNNGDGRIDDPFEVDELGLVNFSKHCNPSVPCEMNDPQTDPDGYDLLTCNTEDSPTTCLESTEPADVRFMMSSGPFDWLAGQTQQVVLGMVFANVVGSPGQLDMVGSPPRPDPNDPALGEFLQVKEVAQGLFDLDFLQATPPPAPNMTLVPGDGQVTLLWDDLPLRTPDRTYKDFVELDPTYRECDFQGFRIWRSRTGTYSRRGDVNDPDFPLTPQAIEENELVEGFDLTLLAQYDLADGITTESHGVSCSESLITQSEDVVFTNCDTFNLGTDTGLRFSLVDRGDPNLPLVNGFRYFYSVTSYDYNSDALPVSRLSLDSGVSFPAENSIVPRSNASSFINAFSNILHVDETGAVLDDTSSIFDPAGSGELDPILEIHASNALVDFTFNPGIPEEVSDDHYTLVLDRFERIDAISNRITYHLEDSSGETVSPGTSNSFALIYDGTDQEVSAAVFTPDANDPENAFEVIFTADLSFNVDTTAFVLPDPDLHFIALNAAGSDISDSLGNVTISSANFIPAGYRGSDIMMEWVAVDEGDTIMTLEVRDLDNRADVPFGEGIVDETGTTIDSEKGSNWSFLPVGGGALQPGGFYFETTAPTAIADLWLCGIRMVVTGMDRMPRDGDVWMLRQPIFTVEVDTTVTPPDSIWLDARRPPVPSTRYRLDTQSGGPHKGDVDLTMIRVVPNPYLATSSFELGPTQKRLEFINLPPECTIRIYTVSGNLVNVLEHTPDEGGTEVYNLRTRYNLPLASGNYFYHVTTPDGNTQLGRFAIVQ
jgi:hypothetical protein